MTEATIRPVEQCPAKLDTARYGLVESRATTNGISRWDNWTNRCVLPVGHEGHVDAVFHEIRILGPGFPEALSIRWLSAPPGMPEDVWQARNRITEEAAS